MGAATPGAAGTTGHPSLEIDDGTNPVSITPKPGVTGLHARTSLKRPVVCSPGRGVEGLSFYVGKSVEDFCAFGYGKKGDPQNHCAHFVGHALNIQVGELCSNLLPWNLKVPSTDRLFRAGARQDMAAGLYTLEGTRKIPFRGASTRVNEIYNSIAAAKKGDWEKRPDPNAKCLMYVTTPGNISPDRATMGRAPKKHIGVHVDGKIYNYGNTHDKVVRDTIEEFQHKFRRSYGKNSVFLWSAIPEVGAACVYQGNSSPA